jgi:hypothetical protein
MACWAVMLGWGTLLGSLAIAGANAADGSTAPRSFEVVVDKLDVFAEPDDAGFVTFSLHRGDRVEVKKKLANGWLAIAVPEGSFYWVESSRVEELRDGRLYVSAEKATLRLGRDAFGQPGPARMTVSEGTVFAPADHQPLKYQDGNRRSVWRAVSVQGDELRFVRASGVIDPTASDPLPKKVIAPERRVAFEAPPADLPPEIAVPMKSIDDHHRLVVSQPLEVWDLSSVRKDYQALLASQANPKAKGVIQERLDQVGREDAMMKLANEFETLVKKSRNRDGDVTRAKEKIRQVREIEELSYDAEGLLQASSKLVDGEKVFSLLNDDGQVVTYLKIPPGVDTLNLLAKKVGVRGKSRFNDVLRYRLLDVRDIEALYGER